MDIDEKIDCDIVIIDECIIKSFAKKSTVQKLKDMHIGNDTLIEREYH